MEWVVDVEMSREDTENETCLKVRAIGGTYFETYVYS